MSQPSMSERLRYRLDSFLERGNGALFMALVAVFLACLMGIVALRLVLHLVSGSDPALPFLHQIWFTFLQLTDPGNMAQDNATPVAFKLSAIAAGLTGVVIFSALIAFLTTALDAAIADLRKGRSRVLEEGHTLVLGWGPRVPEILRELVLANESEDRAVVVILADRDKEAMDEELRARVPERQTTRVVTRSGSPATLHALRHVRAGAASAAVILAGCRASATEPEKQASRRDGEICIGYRRTALAQDPHRNFGVSLVPPKGRKVTLEEGDSLVVVAEDEL